MSFSKAFRYPFQNLAKVIGIVLVLTIAFAAFIGLVLNSHDWSPLWDQINAWDPAEHNAEHNIEEMEAMGATTGFGILGLIVAAALSGFWISGYSVEVVRAVLDKDDVMPGINFSRNLKDGFFLFLSSIAYWILFMVLLAAELFVIQATQSLGAVSALLAIAGLVVTVIALAVMGWAYFVGMARFAAEGNHRAVFDIRRNIGIAGKHRAAGATLLMYMVGLSIIYGGVRSLVDGIFGGAAGMLGITLSIVLYYIFNLMQHFSTQHLIAQYAVQIGIGGDQDFAFDKDKVDYA